MGLDLCLKTEVCPHCGREDSPDFEWNYTYNVSKMWYEVFPESNKMIDIDGMTCKESLPRLEHLRDTIKADPDKFKAMNPPNGYGCYESFVEAVERLIIVAKNYPNGIWVARR